MSESHAIHKAGAVGRWTPYPAYTDSGTDCLGLIPQHWTVPKMKRLCLVKRGASPRPIDDPAYFDDGGDYAWVRISDVTASDKYLLTTEQRLSEVGKTKSIPLEPGELFLSIAATIGKPVITRIKCCIHDGFVYFVGLTANREYLFYLFSSGQLYGGLGKLGTQLNLNTDTIGDIRIPLPPSPEQECIAGFLDRETAKIDALIAKKQRLIELLEEKRAALISHAVTKGLDPNAPMKDSGIEWLGQIPAHWAASRTKFVSKLRTGDACDIPQDLQREIAAKYPGAKVVNLSDLEQDDRGFFQKYHGNACPGLTRVDFYGDGKTTFALVLTRNGGANAHTELVVAHDVGGRWKVSVLGTGGPSPYAPAIWRQPPGQYQDVDGKKSIRATRPVIVFCKYESWSILYAWTGSRVAKIWLQD